MCSHQLQRHKTSLQGILSKFWPLIFAYLILLTSVAALIMVSLSLTEELLIYPLDDSYIHMAIAKHFAEQGIWGIDDTGFASASSSPGWTVLLALCFKCFGVSEWIPLVINLIAGLAGCLLLFYFLEKREIHGSRNLLVLIGFFFLIPLPTVIALGLEHILQILSCLIFVYLVVEQCSNQKPDPLNTVFLMVTSFAVTSLRYEGLFVLFVAVGVLALRHRFSQALGCFILGLLPVIVFGCISLAKGWFFLPSSLLLKGSIPPFTMTEIGSWILERIALLYSKKHIFFILLCSFLGLCTKLAVTTPNWNDKSLLWFTIFLAVLVPHSLFSSYGSFYRYEAYLVVIGLIAMIVFLTDSSLSLFHRKKEDKSLLSLAFLCRVLSITLFVIACLFLCKRGAIAFMVVPQASKNIFDQQYQMAKFAKKFYDHDVIALNDIGMVSFYSDARILDLAGLSSLPVIKMKLSGNYNTAALRQLAIDQKPSIIMIYDSWFSVRRNLAVPNEWLKVGEWTIKDNIICADERVSFYTTSRNEARIAVERLRKFAADLPPDVQQGGAYTQY